MVMQDERGSVIERQVQDPEATRRISSIADMAARASEQVHTYVKFLGD